jgi:hypothetical protein
MNFVTIQSVLPTDLKDDVINLLMLTNSTEQSPH